MKELSVIQALASMPRKEVEEFLKDDFRDISEIFDAILDETEKKYVDFMYRLFKLIDEIEAKESEDNSNE